MVSMTDLSKMHGSEVTAKRLKKRKAAQVRLQVYGILAISLAGLALIALLWSVVIKASGAVTESYVRLPVTIAQDDVDPDATGDPSVIKRGDFDDVTRDAIRGYFSYVKGRTNRRDLGDVLSGGASFELRDKVMADPTLVGTDIEYEFLASDVTDLYLKGYYGELAPLPKLGALTYSTDGEDISLSSTESDFTEIIKSARLNLVGDAEFNREQARLQDVGRVEFERRAEVAEDAETRDANLAEAAKRAAERDRLLGIADGLDQRAQSTTGSEELGEENLSTFVVVDGVWVKLTSVSNSTATGEVAGTLDPVEDKQADSWQLLQHDVAESRRKVSDTQIVVIEQLKAEDRIVTVFNTRFFSAGDSREPELAGIWGAIVGSFWTMLVTMALAFPVGVLAAIYLEEFAKKNVINDFIEVSINNLAAVPSIVFGLLGLAVILPVMSEVFDRSLRSAPLIGGIVLALMTLPTIIIASRAAIKAVPPSIRDAALGLGASKLQTSFHHVLPLAMPGILTGTIIGMAQALGETAPLIMIGMVAFIVDIPGGITDSASVLPVQIFRWSDFPEQAFEAKTAATIVVLLCFLVLMNGLAVFLRKRFERRW